VFSSKSQRILAIRNDRRITAKAQVFRNESISTSVHEDKSRRRCGEHRSTRDQRNDIQKQELSARRAESDVFF
jgi:hypothetical protein